MDFLNAATASARRLVENPYLGRTRLDLAPARYRFWSLTDFSMLLVYDAGQAPIVILRVVHTARDLPALLMGLSLD
jgi:toxin ParE1/3/4